MELKEKLLSLPTTSGVYLMKDKFNNVIYVGKAKNLKRRVNQYFTERKDKTLKTQMLVNNIVNFDFILTNSEYDALMLENNLIKKYQPHYNILLKDGKNFAYLKINLNLDYPKVELTRKVEFKKNIKYFGPYFNGISAHNVLDLIKYAYPLRSCNLALKKPEKRECLKYSLGECVAPCTNRITKNKYNLIVNDVIDFLNGNTEKVKQILLNKMNKCVESLNFESAIVYKNQLEMLNKLNNKFTTQLPKKLNIDVCGIYKLNNNFSVSILIIRNGKMLGVENFNLIDKLIEKDLTNFFVQYYLSNKILPSEIVVFDNFEGKEILQEFFVKNFNKNINIINARKGVKRRLLESACDNAKEFLEKSLNKENLILERTTKAVENLKTKLNLKNLPLRIEGFDISNISGTNKVASMVVFVNGEPNKKHYRKFKIKTVSGINDFACMEEVIKRRMEELCSKDESFSSIPNLILIDGGKGQLSYASKVLREYNKEIDLISLAEKNEEIFKEDVINPIILTKNDYSLQLLQRVRDEAHRFAITFHKNLRNKSELKSDLLNIKGIGKEKAKLLFNKFKTIEKIKNAKLEDLILVKGINENLAKEIVNHFNK